jgi:hypothetical protein
VTRRGLVALAILAASVLGSAQADADDNPALACLEQCKDRAEQCIKAAGDDEEKLRECTSDAMSCVQGCDH